MAKPRRKDAASASTATKTPRRPERPGAARRGRTTALRDFALVAVVAFAVFANTLSLGFVWDDAVIVTAGHRIHRLSEIPSLFTSHAFSGAGDLAARREKVIEYYRPVWTLSLSLDAAIWKDRAFGYHLTNVLLHAAASVTALALFRALLPGSGLALLGALLFAVHPVHAEAVAWVSSAQRVARGRVPVPRDARLRPLSRDREASLRAARAPRIRAGAALKETAVMFPALALLYESRPGRAAARPWRVGPLALTAIATGYVALRHALVHDLPETHSLVSRLLTAPVLVARYLQLVFVPSRSRCSIRSRW